MAPKRSGGNGGIPEGVRINCCQNLSSVGESVGHGAGTHALKYWTVYRVYVCTVVAVLASPAGTPGMQVLWGSSGGASAGHPLVTQAIGGRPVIL
jgi:hypothetical protein